MVSSSVQTVLVHVEKVKLVSKKISYTLFILKEIFLSLRVRKIFPNWEKQNIHKDM